MRLERLNYNKIKIFLTLDDLTERGLTKEDIWKDSLKWHQLFHDMLEEANAEFGVEIHGSVAVEIFSMQAQGMIMIVTMEEEQDEDEDSFDEGFIEMQVIMEGESEEILFELEEFEYAIQLAKRLSSIQMENGSLYSYNDRYYFHLSKPDPEELNRLIAILAEFGNQSMISIHILQEYGKEIIKDNAVKTLVQFFR
jgi:adapter protein MecA 1/2